MPVLKFPPKSFKKGRIARNCWKCGEKVQFLPTHLAPKGAWVDAGTDIHHRCPRTGPIDTIDTIEYDAMQYFLSL